MNVRLIAAVAVIVLIAVALAVNLMAPRGERAIAAVIAETGLRGPAGA